MQQRETQHGDGHVRPGVTMAEAKAALHLVAGWAGEWWAREHAKAAKDPVKFGAEVRSVCLAVLGLSEPAE